MNKQAVGRRREGVTGELRLALQTMLDRPGDIHLSLARASDFAEVLGVIVEREEPLLVTMASQAVASAWAEELTRRGISSRALSARDAPPKHPKVVFVGPAWLALPDHCLWVEKTMRRVLVRGGDAPVHGLGNLPIVSVEVAGEDAVWIPEGARREGFGFARAQFAVRPLGGPRARAQIVDAWRAAGAAERDELCFVNGAHLHCARAPQSFAQLARWIAAANAEQVSVLFGPDDLLRLQLGVAARVLPLLEHGAWPPPVVPREALALLAWLEGQSCRSALYAAAFGEVVEPCGACEACPDSSWLIGPEIPHPPSAQPPQNHTLAQPVVLSSSEAVALETLREWRSKRARADEIPPYIVFGNATLIELVRLRPRDRDSFLAIKGCGERKWQRFGAEVVSLIGEAQI